MKERFLEASNWKLDGMSRPLAFSLNKFMILLFNFVYANAMRSGNTLRDKMIMSI